VYLSFERCIRPKAYGLPTDGDGNTYDTVVIGTQVWLTENLKTTKYNVVISIPLVTDDDKWISTKFGAFCWYNNDPTYKDSYGGLYNWYAVDVGALCPVGLHVATESEWTTMINYLGGEYVAGGKLKETGFTHWQSPNEGATDETGFTARAGGERDRFGTFDMIGNTGYWWTASLHNNDDRYAWKVNIHSGFREIYKAAFPKEAGFSVRCIKDN